MSPPPVRRVAVAPRSPEAIEIVRRVPHTLGSQEGRGDGDAVPWQTVERAPESPPGAPPPAAGIKAILSIAETVTPSFARARRVLGARVLDRYACAEVGPLASQCPVRDDRLHSAGANALVEVFDDEGRPGRGWPPDRSPRRASCRSAPA